MNTTFLNTKLLASRMALCGVTIKAFGEKLGWCHKTTYSKVKGKSAFTVPEIRKCVEILSLDLRTANDIFFESKLS